MHQKKLLAAVILLLCAVGTTRAQAQLDEHKFEIGGLFTVAQLESFDAAVNGLGGRFGYNFNEHFAIDSEISYFPETHLGNDQIGSKLQALVGVRAGARSKYVGVFAKARPGVMFIGERTSGFNCNRQPSVTVCRPEHDNLALDVGGVVEFYPSTRSIIRLDVGDTIVRERQTTRGLLSNTDLTTSTTTNNLQVSIGFGFRF